MAATDINSKDIEIFSPEERKRINETIETASRREPVAPPGIPSAKEALKKGLFPFFINAGAFVLLAAGIMLLIMFQQSSAEGIRESGTVIGITERVLIREIRNETNARLNEKESAIEAMNNRIAEVDAELERLSSLEALTDEQQAAMENLRREHGEYRETLNRLYQEKAQILTEARIREAEIRQREENRRREESILINLTPGNREEVERAREELSLLSGEAEKTALIEKQLSGFYAFIQSQIEKQEYSAAENSLAALSEYLATPGITSLKAIETRHESDMAAIKALSLLLSEAQRSAAPMYIEEAPLPPGADTEEILRQQAQAQAASIAEQKSAITEMNNTITELQMQLTEILEKNDAFTKTIAEKDMQLDNLKSQNASYAQIITTLQKTISDVNAALENKQ